ncbi:MAG: hypothetical protein SFW64_04800 [Alphaproteobacteria bacterium]|nr:hypothetical protein [Alphaproteobacteria bacterium]
MGAAAKLRGENNVFKGAGIWLAGGIAAAAYGNPSSGKQLELLSQKLEKHLNEQGITIPDNVRAQHALLKEPGFIERCQNFLYQHPSEMLNAAYAIGAAYLLKDGVKELASKSKSLWPKFTEGYSLKGMLHASKGISKNFWMGALVGGGAISGLLIKEDPQAHENAVQGNIFQRAVAYIKEKPLRLTGSLYGANNIFTVLKAYEDYANRGLYTKGLKPHFFSGTTAGAYILSNILLTTVSRDQASAKYLSPAQAAQLEDAAAQIIAAQPPEKQQAILADVAGYMAKQKGISLNASEIEAQLTERVAAVTPPAKMEAPAVASFAVKEQARRASAAGQEVAIHA